MEAYKTTCFNCKNVRFWVGYKTGLGKTAEQLAQMEKEETTCIKCGSQNVKTELDRESGNGQIFGSATKMAAKTTLDILESVENAGLE